MKNVLKKIYLLIIGGFGLISFCSCGKNWQPLGAEETTIRVAASPTPHAEILKAAKPLFEAKGYTLIIKEYTDYIQPNLATEDGDVDANYFQHTPYLSSFNEERNTHLVSVGKIHYEPFAIYKGKKDKLEDIAKQDQILIPNDTTNEARALLLLEEAGLIKLKEGIGILATKKDIISNPNQLDIVELEAAQIPQNRKDAAFAVINGNYALQNNLTSTDALLYESSQGISAQAYANVFVVREGNQNHKAILTLYEILTSEEIKAFIADTYSKAVVAI